MRRVHDRGGWPGAGPVPREAHLLEPWEKEIDAILRLLSRPNRGLVRIDEMRRVIESLDLEAYEEMGYYERWAAALERLLGEKGLLSQEAAEPAPPEGGPASR